MQLPQTYCPNCRGGNPPDAPLCQWCHKPMRGRAGTFKTAPLLIGGFMVLCGLFTALAFLAVSAATPERLRRTLDTPSQWIGLAVILLGALLLLIVPGVALIVVSRRKGPS